MGSVEPRRLLSAIFLMLCLSTDVAAVEAEGKRVRFSSGDREIAGVLFEPPGRGPFPTLLQVHASRGQRRGDLELSRRLAEAGYLTLSVDLYSGRVAATFGEGLRLRDRALPRVADDLRAAMAYLRTLPNVSPERIGAIGASAGGGFTLRLAIAEPRLAVAVIYYGHLYDTEVVDDATLGRIQACVLAIDGQESRVSSIPAAKMFANTLREAGKHIELHILPDVGYGFIEPESANYSPDAAEDAFERTLAFLGTHLAGGRCRR